MQKAFAIAFFLLVCGFPICWKQGDWYRSDIQQTLAEEARFNLALGRSAEEIGHEKDKLSRQ